MNVRGRYEPTIPVGRKVITEKFVNTKGYMSVSQRVKLMLKAGGQIMGKPLFQAPEGNPEPINPRSDVHDVLERTKTVAMAAEKAARESEQRLIENIRKQAVEEYLKNNPVEAPTRPVEALNTPSGVKESSNGK